MFRRLFILAAVVSLGLPAVRAQEGAASHAAVIQADTLPALLERLERDPEDIDLLVEICSQYTMRSEFAAIHPYVSRLRRAGAAHDDERALMYADLFSGQSYLLAEGSDSTRIYLDPGFDPRAAVRRPGGAVPDLQCAGNLCRQHRNELFRRHRIFPRSDGVRPQRLAEPLLSGGAVQSGQYVLHAATTLRA